MDRKAISRAVRQDVLIEAGYRCAVPTCRTILALDLHHILTVSEDGPNEAWNLIALCGTCHDLFHRKVISQDAIVSWKGMLMCLNSAFDKESIDNLVFLKSLPRQALVLSGDGVLKFSTLISAQLAQFVLFMQNGPIILYEVFISEKGKRLVDAWFSGNRNEVEEAVKFISQK